MLSLGEKVRRDPGGIVILVGDHHDLGGSCHHVDANMAEYLALGGGDVGVAGANHLGYRRNRLCAVSKCRDRLGSAHAIDLTDTGKLRGNEDEWIEHVFGRRHHHDDARYRGHFGRQRIH